MKLTDAITKTLTGRRSQKTTTKGVLESGKKALGKTWKAVAQESGVSERTLRRIRAGGKMSKSTQQKIDALGKRNEVRRAGIKPRAAKKLQQGSSNGARVKFSANQGPLGRGGGDYRRPRNLDFVLPPEAVSEIQAAYESGDDERMHELMEGYVADYGWSDWTPQGGWEIGETDNWSFDPI